MNQQHNISLLRNKISMEARNNSVRINLLKNIVKILYDDISYEIINYIINLKGEKAEEQILAEKLNLNHTQVRQSLIQMEKHGILISAEFKKKRNEEEEQKNQQRFMNANKYKTSEWELNETFYNTMKNRFSDLIKKLESNLKNKETLKFECPKCKKIFMLEKAAHLDYNCNNCIDKQNLSDKKPE